MVGRVAEVLALASLALLAQGHAGCGVGRGGDGRAAAEPGPGQTTPEARMSARQRLDTAVALMTGFAARTGLEPDGVQERYLWTDAFAVCNFLGLADVTGEPRYRELALRLVERVHRTLGRHRPDDARQGWISGLDEAEGERHPTRGGLRIGKPLPERAPNERFDERLEWDRDGQYFHYLTQWMHALDRVSQATAQPVFNQWGRELADAAVGGFSHGAAGGGQRRMYWKMSIDLSRPLVPSMGQHDALDGYVTCAELEATAARLPSPSGPRLAGRMAELSQMMGGQRLATTDPLGLGGLLLDAWRLHRLDGQGRQARALLEEVLDAAREGLAVYARQGELGLPATQRLAFRELGLAIGLQALSHMVEEAGASRQLRTRLDALAHYTGLATTIEAFWLDPAHRRAATWVEHRNINEVMLATSLVPTGFLALAEKGPGTR